MREVIVRELRLRPFDGLVRVRGPATASPGPAIDAAAGAGDAIVPSATRARAAAYPPGQIAL